MNKAERNALRTLANAATPGPWNSSPSYMCNENYVAGCSPWVIAVSDDAAEDTKQAVADAQFIAAAREAIPKLLDYIDKLQEYLCSHADIKRPVDGREWCGSCSQWIYQGDEDLGK